MELFFLILVAPVDKSEYVCPYKNITKKLPTFWLKLIEIIVTNDLIALYLQPYTMVLVRAASGLKKKMWLIRNTF